MATDFEPAGYEVTKWFEHAVREWHPKLAEAGVRYGVLVATNEAGEPAVKHGGYPAAATVKVVGPKDRVTKGYDAEITVDGQFWHEATDQGRAALADHELSHLEVVEATTKQLKAAREEAGTDDVPWWRVDRRNRPKLRLRKADANVGDMFSACIARHGEHANEYRNIAAAKAFADRARAEGGAS